jgi:hypothetical protein
VKSEDVGKAKIQKVILDQSPQTKSGLAQKMFWSAAENWLQTKKNRAQTKKKFLWSAAKNCFQTKKLFGPEHMRVDQKLVWSKKFVPDQKIFWW